MKRARPFLAVLLAFAPAALAISTPPVALAQSSAPPLPPAKRGAAPLAKVQQQPLPPLPTGSINQRPPQPLANVSMLHIDMLPLQGDADKCGLEFKPLQTAAVYPIAASARLKVGQGTLTHMHVRLSAVFVSRLDHCILHTDVRVSSLQQVELQHSKVAMPAYVPLWEKTDIRLAPRGMAQRVAVDRLRQISEQLLIDWAGQN